MTVISKAALAAELHVSKARVSQYVNAGLPVRSDGQLDRENALNWISLNLRSGNDRKKGPARARTLTPVQPPTRSLGDARAARLALEGLGSEVGYYVVSVAADLDLPMRVVYALAKNLLDGLDDIVREQLRRFGADGSSNLETDPKAFQVDWHVIAEGQGEEVDFEAWEAYRAEMYEKAG